jgi:pyruvate carboxylase
MDELMAAGSSMTFPLFVKAVAGGGGRGMRRVEDGAGLREAIEAASREPDSAFGDATMFLYERDCSVQRRHQMGRPLAAAR